MTRALALLLVPVASACCRSTLVTVVNGTSTGASSGGAGVGSSGGTGASSTARATSGSSGGSTPSSSSLAGTSTGGSASRTFGSSGGSSGGSRCVPDGGFAPAAFYDAGNAPALVGAADFNGDGKLDLAVADNVDATVGILLNNGDGTFAAPVAYPALPRPGFGTVADLNGDGWPDVAITTLDIPTSVSVYLNTGTGALGPAVNTAVAESPAGIAAGDFNGDGALDLVVAIEGGIDAAGVAVLLNDGHGAFPTSVVAPLTGAPTGIAVADFDGDGNLDVVVTLQSGAAVAVLLGRGDGTLGTATTFAVQPAPFGVAVADFNGDGRPDIAAGHQNGPGDGLVSVLLNADGGTFQPEATYLAGSEPVYLAAADFNADGHPDLAVANFNGNTVSLLLNNGDGTFAPQVAYLVGAVDGGQLGPNAPVAASFTDSGGLDLAVSNVFDNQVAVLLQVCE